MPIGKGFVFASDCLEDIVNTKKFFNNLMLFQKDWTPKEYYVPTDPIGTFDIGKE
jgi:hypothetical protein